MRAHWTVSVHLFVMQYIITSLFITRLLKLNSATQLQPTDLQTSVPEQLPLAIGADLEIGLLPKNELRVSLLSRWLSVL